MGTTAGVLFALGVSKGAAVNFALASGLLLTGAALAAAALGLSGSLLLTFRARRAPAAAIPAQLDTRRNTDRATRAFVTAAAMTKKSVAVGDVAPIAALAPARARRVPASAGS